MNPLNLAVIWFSCFVVSSFPAYADDVEKQIESASRSYRAGQHRQAIQQLDSAIVQIQELLNRQLLTLLPDPPPGWQAQEAKIQTGPMTVQGEGVHLVRTYRRESEQVQIEMITNSPMLSALHVIFNDPAMLAGNPNTQPYRYQDYPGMLKKQNDSLEMSLLIGQQTLLKLKGDQLQNSDVLSIFLESIDFKRIEEMLASASKYGPTAQVQGRLARSYQHKTDPQG
jgi:hypothetical protein